MGLLKDYVFKLNLKAVVTYEHLAGKPYGGAADVEDMAKLSYAILAANNNVDFTYEIYSKLLGEKRTANEIAQALERVISTNIQYLTHIRKQPDMVEEGDNEPGEVWYSDIANTLIVGFGLDPHYVMYEMELWELNEITQACVNKQKGDLIEKRLFAFLQMSPLRLGKNTKGPEDILPFTWEEKDKKKKQEDNLELQTNAVKGLFKKKDGKRRTDNSTGPEGLPENGAASVGNGEC